MGIDRRGAATGYGEAERPGATPGRSREISVVVTGNALNRLGDIDTLVASLGAQTCQRMAVIFVAEESRELADRVKSCGERHGIADFRVVVSQGRGLSSGRNAGIEHSESEIVAFIDDDAAAFPDWAENILKTFQRHPSAIGVTGPAYPQWDGLPLRWFPEEFYWLLSCPTPGWIGVVDPTPVRNAWGVNMAFRREAFEVARFSEAFSGGEKTGADDVEFSMHLRQATGKIILFDPSVRVHHKAYPHRLSFMFIWKKAFRDGYAKALLRRLYPERRSASFELDLEKRLLRRILLGFFPAALARVFRDPIVAWHQLKLAFTALFCTAVGYTVGNLLLLPGLARFHRVVRPSRL